MGGAGAGAHASLAMLKKRKTRTRTTMICPKRARWPNCPCWQPYSTSVAIRIPCRQKQTRCGRRPAICGRAGANNPIAPKVQRHLWPSTVLLLSAALLSLPFYGPMESQGACWWVLLSVCAMAHPLWPIAQWRRRVLERLRLAWPRDMASTSACKQANSAVRRGISRQGETQEGPHNSPQTGSPQGRGRRQRQPVAPVSVRACGALHYGSRRERHLPGRSSRGGRLPLLNCLMG